MENSNINLATSHGFFYSCSEIVYKNTDRIYGVFSNCSGVILLIFYNSLYWIISQCTKYDANTELFYKNLIIKTQLLYIDHPLRDFHDRWNPFYEGQLTRCRNVVCETDLKNKTFTTQIISTQKFQEADLKDNFVIMTNGICMGMSMAFINDCLLEASYNKQITEDLLIKIAKKYEKGGSVEAAALQAMFDQEKNHKTEYYKQKIHITLQNSLKRLKQNIKNDKTNLEDFENLEELTEDEKILLESAKKFEMSGLEEEELDYKEDSNFVNDNSIEDEFNFEDIRITIAKKIHVNLKTEDKNIQDIIESAPMGFYYVATKYHAMVFCKAKDGNYLWDPNLGLLRCDKENPSVTIRNRIKYYEGEDISEFNNIFSSELLHKI